MAFLVKTGQKFSKGSVIGVHATEGKALDQALAIAPRWKDWQATHILGDGIIYRWEDGPDYIEVVEQKDAEE